MGGSLKLLFAAVGLMLLIGCANVSILLLARGAARRHELALRASIGAGRARIMRQLLTESLIISACGAAAGILLARELIVLIMKWMPENLFPSEAAVQVNVPVLLFTTLIALLSGVLFGLCRRCSFRGRIWRRWCRPDRGARPAAAAGSTPFWWHRRSP
jgi:ABC-type antimicrobial peptide transport system permease subunit